MRQHQKINFFNNYFILNYMSSNLLEIIIGLVFIGLLTVAFLIEMPSFFWKKAGLSIFSVEVLFFAVCLMMYIEFVQFVKR